MRIRSNSRSRSGHSRGRIRVRIIRIRKRGRITSSRINICRIGITRIRTGSTCILGIDITLCIVVSIFYISIVIVIFLLLF